MTSPLSPEAVAQMVADLTTKAAMINMGEKIAWGSDSGVMDAAADMITTLSAENATLRAETRESAMQYLSDAGQAMDRIAALTEVLKETAAILSAAVVAGKVRGGDSYRIGGVYLQTVSDALDAADAALTTDKEPNNGRL